MLGGARTYRIFLLFLLTAVGLTSCKNSRINKLKEVEGKYVAKVVTSAGDIIDQSLGDTLNFMAFPFNIGFYDTNKTDNSRIIIVGKSINKRENVSFRPIAKLTYQYENQEVVVVAVPTNKKYMTVDIKTYYELLSVHYGVQKLIDTWYTHSKGFGALQSIKWENEDVAKKFLEL